MPNLRKGDMVIIKEDNLPPMKWPLGRVLNVFSGDDGAVRVAEIKTPTGVFKRAIHRLAPLFPEDHDNAIIDKDTTQESTISYKKKSVTDEHGRDVIPAKRVRIANSPIILSVLLTLFLIPMVLCNNLKVTQFHNDPGLYFEGLGTMKLNTAEWKMLVYYDLKPFVSEIESLASGLQTLQQMCHVMHQHEMCNIFVNNLKQTKNELLQDKVLLINKRVKRSPFNIIGNIAHSLFGVLDTDYAEEMSKTINQAKGEQDHIISLLKNQTSIIDSTINVIKRDEINTHQKIREILKMIDKHNNDIAEESAQFNNSQLFGLLSTHLMLSAINT